MTAVFLAAVIVFVTGPPTTESVVPAAISSFDRTIRGAFHIHTTRSDGALDKAAVAAAAARAGLQFAVFTDHGNGLRAPDPPTYIHGVLCVDGVEISTSDGHYISVGMSAAPYPLGGDARAVAEDVARLGGFGVAAHPVSARAELSWSDWSVPIDGIEWLNADSEWRDERRLRLGRALLDYLWRPAGALATLLDRPVAVLQRWDQLTSTRQVVALAGHDAHGGLGAETGTRRGRRLHMPSYEASFRTFSVHVVLSHPLTADPAADAAALVDALRSGAVYSSVDAIAAPAALDFRATAGGTTVTMGQILPIGNAGAEFSIRAAVPAGSTTYLKRNGDVVAQQIGGVLEHQGLAVGAYRVEIEVQGAPGTPPVPWLVGNPIYLQTPKSAKPVESAASHQMAVPLSQGEWRVESDPGSSGTVVPDRGSVSFTYHLKPPPESSQFAALVVDLQSVPSNVTTMVLRGRSDQPMRLSTQLRFAQDQDRRWGRSIYLDPREQEISVPLEQLRYLGGSTLAKEEPAPPQPSVARASSLLFVVDLTNSTPGTKGSFILRDIVLATH